MIVQPDFCDHWKTRHVVRKTGSEATVRCILRLWSHCQQRRRWVFPDLTAEVLASICGWEGEPAALWDAMVGTFLDVTDAGIEAHDWAEANLSLISNWQKGQYGSQGGRPRKNPEGFPKVNGENLGETPSKPDKRREDKIRKEGISEAKASSPHLGGAGRNGKGSDSPTQQEIAAVVDAYHRLCPSLPKVQRVSGKRLASTKARWREVGKEAVQWFEQLFRLAGESNRIREGTWCSFDWLVSPANSQKVIEGNYANNRGTPPNKQHFIN